MSERNVKCQRKFLMSCRLKWDVYCIYTYSLFLFRQTVPCEPYGLWTIVQTSFCADRLLPSGHTHTHMQDWWKTETLYQRIRQGKVLGSICEILCVYSYKLTFIHTCAHTNEYLDSKIIKSMFGFVEHNASYHLYMHTSLPSFCFRLTHTTQKPADSLIII